MSQRDDTGAGGVFFAGVILIVGGFFWALEGLAAVARSAFFVPQAHYYINISASSWGWVHLILGIIVLLAGFGVLRGATWARVVGITLASLSAIVNFLFIPYYPFWAILIILLDMWVIWALAAHGRALAD